MDSTPNNDPGAEQATTAQPPLFLIPWDPDSPDHVERMRLQRVACGWNVDQVGKWREQQKRGDIGLHWIVLHPAHPSTPSRVAAHLAAFPDQAAPLLRDTCAAVFSRPHVPDPASSSPSPSSFCPVGHISLDGTTPASLPELGADPAAGVYSLATFWVSRPLQGGGLGGFAVDVCEGVARTDFGAKAITISTIAQEEHRPDNPRLLALGRTVPRISNQEWYQRRGYKVFARKQNAWYDTDPTGKAWGCNAVLMRKDLV
ncbi:hypothetical protein GGR56DRAFT_650329 [Xylariaceae sp. FL0804]|nr:hypothetical protein GGR56DRAFT_650329 [Xylariaceae sp. FL0804]